jgi:hypothetical protein
MDNDEVFLGDCASDFDVGDDPNGPNVVEVDEETKQRLETARLLKLKVAGF